jgi:antitoxin PrlF
MAVTVRNVRLGARAQVVLPKEARHALGLEPGDIFAFVIDGEDIRVVRAAAEGDDPFACFSEWTSEADRRSLAFLIDRRRPGALPQRRDRFRSLVQPQ